MAQEEKKVEKIERLTNNQANIRNIATSAHIHHGKCISGDSRVMLSNGSVITARDIYEEVAKNGKIYKDNEEHTVFIPKDKITIFSLNKETGSIEKKPVQYVWRLKGGDTIKISLRNGFDIATTPEHKYIIFQNMKFIEKPACELKINDLVVCAKNIDYFWKEKKANKEDYNYNKVEIEKGNSQKLFQLIKNPYDDLAFVEVKKIEAGF